jgi:RNA polymerase sigma-70 factor (sigma-E family)
MRLLERDGTLLPGLRGSAVTTSGSGDLAERTTPATETLAASAAAAELAGASALTPDLDAAAVMVALFTAHYRSLVRLAALLLRDTWTAEEVVQDSFVAMHTNGRRLRDSGKALLYLRQCVLNRSRSVLRHRQVVERHAPQPLPDMPSAEHGAMTLLDRSSVIAALHRLPQRQREVLVLRYYADLSGPQIAAVMGISQGAVKCHIARALKALRSTLERELEPTLR